MTIGEKIQTRRKELKITIQDIADFCGVAKSTVHYWINDDTKRLKLPQIRLLAVLLKVDPRSLMYDDMELEPNQAKDELDQELIKLVIALPFQEKIALYNKLNNISKEGKNGN